MREKFRKQQFGRGREDGKKCQEGLREREHTEVWDVKMEHHQIHSVNIKTVGWAAELMAGVQDEIIK